VTFNKGSRNSVTLFLNCIVKYTLAIYISFLLIEAFHFSTKQNLLMVGLQADYSAVHQLVVKRTKKTV
jgi:hypothetical protein